MLINITNDADTFTNLFKSTLYLVNPNVHDSDPWLCLLEFRLARYLIFLSSYSSECDATLQSFLMLCFGRPAQYLQEFSDYLLILPYGYIKIESVSLISGYRLISVRTDLRLNRVVHSWHFRFIFRSFLNHFPFHFVSIFLKIETENERKMNIKWNPNLAFAKRELKNDHFSSFWPCAWREECIFAPFF